MLGGLFSANTESEKKGARCWWEMLGKARVKLVVVGTNFTMQVLLINTLSMQILCSSYEHHNFENTENHYLEYLGDVGKCLLWLN